MCSLLQVYWRSRFGRPLPSSGPPCRTKPSDPASWAITCFSARFDRVLDRIFQQIWNFTDFRQLERARSRLYRSRFLQPNTHFAVFFEIYKNIILLHRSQFKILANFRRKLFANFQNFVEILPFFIIFIKFYTDFDEIFSEFRQIP